MITKEQQSIIDSIKNQFEELNKPTASRGKYIDAKTIIDSYKKEQDKHSYIELRNKQVESVIDHKIQVIRDNLATDLCDLNLEVEWERLKWTSNWPHYKIVITHRMGLTNQPHEIFVYPDFDKSSEVEGIFSSENLNFHCRDLRYRSHKHNYYSIEEYCEKEYLFKEEIEKLYKDNAHLFK